MQTVTYMSYRNTQNLCKSWVKLYVNCTQVDLKLRYQQLYHTYVLILVFPG